MPCIRKPQRTGWNTGNIFETSQFPCNCVVCHQLLSEWEIMLPFCPNPGLRQSHTRETQRNVELISPQFPVSWSTILESREIEVSDHNNINVSSLYILYVCEHVYIHHPRSRNVQCDWCLILCSTLLREAQAKLHQTYTLNPAGQSVLGQPGGT